MQLQVLVDNNTFIGQYYKGEPGFSCYIEDAGHRILFDLGYSGVFWENAEAMGIDLQQVDTLAFSHPHDDHTRGLRTLIHRHPAPLRFLAHTEIFTPCRLFHGASNGLEYRQDELPANWQVALSSGPVRITERLYWLGQIPRRFDFELPTDPHRHERLTENGWELEHFRDDTALAWKGEDGLFIISGCSHSGICNIVEYAKEVCGEERVYGILGGFHLRRLDEQTAQTIAYMEQLRGLKELYAGHCTGFAARITMAKTLPLKELGVGLKLELR